MTHEHDDNEQIRPGEAELTRLADGSLPESEREQLQTTLASSPELRTRLREQQRAVGLVQSTAAISAPAALRASVAELTDATGRKRGRGHARTAADRRQRQAGGAPDGGSGSPV